MTDIRTEAVFEEAARWHARVQGENVDWDDFAAWLDAEASNQRAYEQIAMIEDEVARWASRHDQPVVANDQPIERSGIGQRRWIASGALAACLVAVVSVPMLKTASTAPSLYYSASDAQKLVPLSDGSSARLDRGTRIAIADGGKGAISLEAGSVYFDVRHNPNREFVVQSGDFAVRDIGTRFAVTRRDSQMSVAVEQGIVEVSWRGGTARELKAGQNFDGSGEGQAVITRVEPKAVASWRDNRLIYDNTPLSVVAADISRYTQNAISVDPAVADLKLSGILLIEDGSHLVDQIKALLPVDSRRENGRTRLVRSVSQR